MRFDPGQGFQVIECVYQAAIRVKVVLVAVGTQATSYYQWRHKVVPEA